MRYIQYMTLKDGPTARGIRIRDEFVKFYETNYSANRMKLVILARQSLNKLENWVVELFSAIVDKELPQNRWDSVEPLTGKELGMQIFAKSVSHMQSLELRFPYPNEEALYDSQPGQYLSELIGHEGPGSILALLKNKNWADGLQTCAYSLCPDSGSFSISIQLTKDGLEHNKEVAATVFQYISMLKDTKAQEWFFNEMKQIREINFRFSEKSPASETTSALAQVMQRPLPREYLLSGPTVLRTFDPRGIQRALSHLRPDNFRSIIMSHDFPGDWDMTERWYGTEYKCQRMSDGYKRHMSDAASTTAPIELHIPTKNEFIPSRLEVLCKDTSAPLKAPILIRNDGIVRVWFKKDDQFLVPKANLHILLRSHAVMISPKAFGIAWLYATLVRDALSAPLYMANIAGLNYEIMVVHSGISIKLSGYNDKMRVLLEKVLTQMHDLTVDPNRFCIVKERAIRDYKSAELQEPYRQIGIYRLYFTDKQTWTHEEIPAALPNITWDDVRTWYPTVLRQAHTEILAHGNFCKEDAIDFANVVEKILQPQKTSPSPDHSVKYCTDSNYIYENVLPDPCNVNHCIEYLLYVGNAQDRRLRAKVLLFSKLAEEPCFHQLRTTEQLGYVVFSGIRLNNAWLGYHILVQSEYHPRYLEGRIESFLDGLGNLIDGMTEVTFGELKDSLIKTCSERLKNLNEECERFHAHILNGTYDFERGTWCHLGDDIYHSQFV